MALISWWIFSVQTGSIFFEGKHLTHWKYCLNPKPDNEQSDKLILDAHVCSHSEIEPEPPLAGNLIHSIQFNSKMVSFYSFQLSFPASMMLSVPFIVATILVYIILPELHNLYGKCLIFHLMSLAMGYAILGVTQLNERSLINSDSLGYAAYFSFISSFFWISIISFELYLNFR